MKLEKMVEVINGVLPSHSKVLKPVFKKVSIPVQLSIEGFFPNVTKRKTLMGAFYEGVNRAFYGGELNDVKFDIEYENGNEVSSRTIKPDIIDERGDIHFHWESKSGYYDKDCKIMARQLVGYKFLQYSRPETRYMFSFFRSNLPELEKKERTEQEIIETLLRQTLYSVTLPLPIVLSIDENQEVSGRKISRQYVAKKESTYPSCLCIRPGTLHSFLSEPEEMINLLGLPLERFEIQRIYSPKIIVNRRQLKPFPLIRINDLEHEDWVSDFMEDYSIGAEDPEIMKLLEKEFEGDDNINIELKGEKISVPFDDDLPF